MDANRPPNSPADPSDAELLRRCATDPGAVSRLFDRYGGALAQYLYRILGSREDAEEVVADVFLRAWRSAAGFRGDGSARSWLYQIAYHLAIDRMRRRSRHAGAVLPFSDLDAESVAAMTGEPETTFFDAYERERDWRALCQALQRLAPADRALLALRCLEECSYEQIGEITGSTLAEVKSRLHRARERLKRHFAAVRESDEAVETLDVSLAGNVRENRRLKVL